MRSYKNIIPYSLNAITKASPIVLAIILGVTCFWLYQLKSLKFDGDISKLLDRPTKSAKVLENLYQNFTPQTDGVLYFNFETTPKADEFIGFLKSLNHFVSTLDGIKMDSLLNITTFEKTMNGSSKVRPFLDQEFVDKNNIDYLDKLKHNYNYRNIYFDEDGKSYLVRFEIQQGNQADQLIGLKQIRDFVYASPFIQKLNKYSPNAELIFYGGPLTEEAISQSIRKDLFLLIPLSLAFICIILWRNFSSLKGVFLSFSTTVLSLIWTLGFMAYEGQTLGIADIFLPILLLACCSSYSIYFLSQFFEALNRSKLPVNDAIKSSIYKDYIALGISIFTTGIGFASFTLCESITLQVFGRYLTIGISFSALMIFLYLPAAIQFMYGRSDVQIYHPPKERRNKPSILLSISQKIFLFATQYKNIVLATIGSLFLLSLWIYSQLSTDFTISSLYGKKSQFYTDFKKINDTFAIGADFYIVLESQKPRHFKTQEGIDQLWLTEDIISKQVEVTNSFGVPFILREFNTEISHKKSPSRDQASDAFLLSSFMEENPLRSFLSIRYEVARFLVRTKLESASELTTLAYRIEKEIQNKLAQSSLNSKDLKVYAISEKIVMDEANKGLLQEQKISLLYTSIFVSLCFFLFYRSIKIGLISFVPNIVPVCLNFLFMWLMNIPLDFSTILIAASALGISVDDTAHIIETYLINLKNYRYFFLKDKLKTGKTDIVHLALYKTFSEIGPSAIRTTLALMVAIGLLYLSNFEAVRNLGICFSMTLFFCLVCDLLLLPALLKRLSL